MEAINLKPIHLNSVNDMIFDIKAIIIILIIETINQKYMNSETLNQPLINTTTLSIQSQYKV